MRTVWLLTALAALGCGRPSEPSTVAVTGMVLFDGKPLDDATVGLMPTSGMGTTTRAQTANGGRFTLTTVPGQKRIEIYAYREAALPPNAHNERRQNYIPSRYNANSELVVAITLEGPNDLDLKLDSK